MGRHLPFFFVSLFRARPRRRETCLHGRNGCSCGPRGPRTQRRFALRSAARKSCATFSTRRGRTASRTRAPRSCATPKRCRMKRAALFPAHRRGARACRRRGLRPLERAHPLSRDRLLGRRASLGQRHCLRSGVRDPRGGVSRRWLRSAGRQPLRRQPGVGARAEETRLRTNGRNCALPLPRARHGAGSTVAADRRAEQGRPHRRNHGKPKNAAPRRRRAADVHRRPATGKGVDAVLDVLLEKVGVVAKSWFRARNDDEAALVAAETAFVEVLDARRQGRPRRSSTRRRLEVSRQGLVAEIADCWARARNRRRRRDCLGARRLGLAAGPELEDAQAAATGNNMIAEPWMPTCWPRPSMLRTRW